MWQEKWAPPGMYGFRLKRGTDDLIWELGAAVEEIKLRKMERNDYLEDLFGASFDYKKCFDQLPHEIAFALAEYMGMSRVLIKVLREVYATLERHFKLPGGIGEPMIPTNGILQGCPLSIILLNIIMSVWARRTVSIPKVVAAPLYADDKFPWTKCREALLKVISATLKFAKDTGQEINLGKSFWFTTAAN